MSAEAVKRRVVLVGAGPTAQSALLGLVDEFDVVALFRSTDDETSEEARRRGVPVRTDMSLNAVRAGINELHPDAVVVSSYDRILDAELVERRPFVNVHYAPLPRGRGRATVNWALINGDREVAISIHRLVPGLDAGGILYQATVPIGPRSTVTSLYAELNDLQQAHIASAVSAAMSGVPGEPQDESEATYLCTRVPDDGDIDWNWSTDRIDRFVRALQDPYPPAFTWRGLERLEIMEATPVEDQQTFEGRVPGRVARVNRQGGWIDVLTGDGVLRIIRVRAEGGDEQNAADVVSSVRATLGLRSVDVVAALRAVRAAEPTDSRREF